MQQTNTVTNRNRTTKKTCSNTNKNFKPSLQFQPLTHSHRTIMSGPYRTTKSGPYQRRRNSPPPAHYYPGPYRPTNSASYTSNTNYYRGPAFGPPLTPSECGGRYPIGDQYRSPSGPTFGPPMAPSGDYYRSPSAPTFVPPMAPSRKESGPYYRLQKQKQRKHHLFKEQIREEEKEVSKMLKGSLYVPSNAQVETRGMKIMNVGGFKMRFGGLSIEEWEEKVSKKMLKFDYDHYKLQAENIPPDVNRATYLIRYLCETEEECWHNLEVTYDNRWDGIKHYTKEERPEDDYNIPRPNYSGSDYVLARVYVKTWVGHAIQMSDESKFDNADVTAASTHWLDTDLPQHSSLIAPFINDPRVNPFAKKKASKKAVWRKAKFKIDISIIKELTFNEWQLKQMHKNKIIDIYFCPEYVHFLMKFPMYHLDLEEMKTGLDSKCENVKNKTLGTNALDTPEELYSSTEAQKFEKICPTILKKYGDLHITLVE